MTAEWTSGDAPAAQLTLSETPAFHSPARCGCGAPLPDEEDVLCDACALRRAREAQEEQRTAAPMDTRPAAPIDTRRFGRWIESARERLDQAATFEAKARQLRHDVANEAIRAVNDAGGSSVMVQLASALTVGVRR